MEHRKSEVHEHAVTPIMQPTPARRQLLELLAAHKAILSVRHTLPISKMTYHVFSEKWLKKTLELSSHRVENDWLQVARERTTEAISKESIVLTSLFRNVRRSFAQHVLARRSARRNFGIT